MAVARDWMLFVNGVAGGSLLAGAASFVIGFCWALFAVGSISFEADGSLMVVLDLDMTGPRKRCTCGKG
jgi:hypothetical protein